MKASINSVHRRVKELNIHGYRPPSFKRTTIGDPLLEDSPNLIKDAVINGINKIWVSDITYIATKEGWLYLCLIMDLFSRKIVGWSTRSDITMGIVLDAFTMAHTQRKSHQKIILHSDKGGQYKAKKFIRKLKRLAYSQIMTGVNHCYDNATAESFFDTFKSDLIRGHIFKSRADADSTAFEHIESFYNRVRLHSSIGYRLPEEFENTI